MVGLNYLVYRYYQSFGQVSLHAVPEIAVIEQPSNPTIRRPTQIPGAIELLEGGVYGLVSPEQVRELGSEIDTYIPQMINDLRDFEPSGRSCKQSKMPSAARLLIAAGAYAVPSLIEMLDEPGQRYKSLHVLSEIGPAAESALAVMTDILLEDRNCLSEKEDPHVASIKSTMNAIRPGSADAVIQLVRDNARDWQADIRSRLQDRRTSKSAYAEAIVKLTCDELTLVAAAEEILVEAAYSPWAYKQLLNKAASFPHPIFLKLDSNGTANCELLWEVSTPQLLALGKVLGAHAEPGLPILGEILDDPTHNMWLLAADAEVLYGNPSEHIENLVNGFLTIELWPLGDVAYKFLRQDRKQLTLLLAGHLAETDSAGRSRAARVFLDMYEETFEPYSTPNQEPILGLEAFTQHLLTASRTESSEARRASLFLMRYIEDPGHDVIERLAEEVRTDSSGWIGWEPRIAFESLYSMSSNDPAIIEFALEQVVTGNPEHQRRAAEILALKGKDDPRPTEALEKLNYDRAVQLTKEVEALNRQ